jgi:hypothetical protein
MPSSSSALAATTRLCVASSVLAASGLALATGAAAAPVPTPLARDSFSRAVTGGLGATDSGQAWTATGPAYSVSGGRGHLALPAAGAGAAAALPGVSSAATDVRVSLGLEQAPVGGPVYASVAGRRVAGSGEYRVKLRYGPDGAVVASLVRTGSSGAETTLRSAPVAGLRAGAGTLLDVHLRVSGTSPTTVQANVWRDGVAEPGGWLLGATDGTAGLQRAGSVGVLAYLSGTATGSGQSLAVDDLSVASLGQPVDGEAPDTLLTGGPAEGSVQTDTSATLSFSSSDAGATFACRLDERSWASCASGATFPGLALGSHTVAVRAVDAAGNVDPTPAARQFTVVAGAPARPGPGNTGVPAGTVLTRHDGDLVITQAGAHYDALDIHGFVTVKAPNVTITRSIIRGGRATGNLGLITNTSASATNFTLSDSELVPEFPSVWLDGLKGFNFTAIRVNAHGTVDAVKIYGPNVRIEGSWLHDTVDYASDPNQGGSYTHNDGVQILSGSNIHISGNSIHGASNAALQVTQDHGTVDADFTANWVDGGNCTINVNNKPLPTLTGMTIRDNRFGHDTRYTDCALISQPGVTLQVSGNVWDDTGLPARLRLAG